MLDLESMGLAGSISPYVGNLSFLNTLILYNNHFEGEIPQEIGRLFRLQVLVLKKNALTGTIPRNLTSCKELVYLVLSENKLVGEILVELGTLSMLESLELSENQLKGIIPVTVSNLSALSFLILSSNDLHSNIPSELGKLSRLKVFQVSNNTLSGNIPPQLLNISSITNFAAAKNELHGSIPPNLGITLPNLQYFVIGGNRFSGSLPNSLSNLSRLERLEVEENKFTGGVPSNLGTLQALTYLNFQNNSLGNGEVDDLSFLSSLSNCSHLQKLYVGYNNLTGHLLKAIANFSAELTLLSMVGNSILGEIPPGIENLVNLEGLGLDGNLLTGGIPVSIGKLSKLVALTMANNQLSGKIPLTICNNSTQLEKIVLLNNRFEGTIPASIGNCRRLNALSLSGNQLFGSIPKELFGLSSLSFALGLSDNKLTGNLPSEVGNLDKLISLDLLNNRLSGEIPSSLEKCLGLRELDLQGNLFEGRIPPLQSLKGIEYLDLSRNSLSGQIPGYLESFDYLEYLNLSSNDLEGEVPVQGIFKNISAFSVLGNDKLCGGIPVLHLPSCPKPDSKKLSKKYPLKRLLLIIFGVIICVIFLGSFVVLFWRRRKPMRSYSSMRTPVDDKFHKVSYSELLKATDGFSAENLLGAGSYGSVYKGLLILNQEAPITPSVVAVKVLDLQRRGASKSFMAECKAMRCIRHRNLVKLLTSCSSIDYKGNEFKALVSEFMPNGNLENWLHPTADEEQLQRSARRSLSFMERLNVAIDVASALNYLHRDCQTPIVHCDLKPSNVLLDDDMNGHVGDFGLAKFLGGVIINVVSEHHTNSTSVGIRGSIGYAAPEYGMGSDVSANGDVYSYGIMVLELFTGKRPTDGMFTDGLSLHTFVKTALLRDQVMQIVDPTVLLAPVHPQDDDDNNEILVDRTRDAKLHEALSGIVTLGVACSIESPRERMEMVQVLKELQSIKITHLYRLGSE